jgi:hypothetical protein
LTALSSVLGIVETVVIVARSLVDSISQRDFVIVRSSDGSFLLKSTQDLAMHKVDSDPVGKLVSLFERSKRIGSVGAVPASGSVRKRSLKARRAGSQKSKPAKRLQKTKR